MHTARSSGQPGCGGDPLELNPTDTDRMAQYGHLCWHVNRQAQTVLSEPGLEPDMRAAWKGGSVGWILSWPRRAGSTHGQQVEKRQ